ncbi:GPP34 family phosphoprotein [Actinotalea sp. K2]|uniref:GOLPH3/VPS74 family protein n=1 Tax=Actinotalea sp. K2 TaxID=2939438 RepID=UPI002017285C|nr:GPP34 family phosphoprotein [Actinotalea sp. K2]MCL3859843.1 GPP34 family phosphoprotein [Actinotalea sp. K2]
MTQPPEDPRVEGAAETPGGAKAPDAPTLAEDLLLLLFQPASGTIAGETTLYYVLAGAALADLALDERVTTTGARTGTESIEAVDGRAPSDEILLAAWDYVSERPRDVQTLLAAIGPTLRQPLLGRLIARGDLRKVSRKVLGLLTTTALEDGGNGRRLGLLEDVRDVLVDGAEPTPRTAALAALIWASGTLPQFDPWIPWTSSVVTRAQELERGSWGAGAAGEAVTRTTSAIIVNSVVVATAALPR